jgi:hypothetical protein
MDRGFSNPDLHDLLDVDRRFGQLTGLAGCAMNATALSDGKKWSAIQFVLPIEPVDKAAVSAA